MSAIPSHRRAAPCPVAGNYVSPKAPAAPENRAVMDVPETRAAPAGAPAKNAPVPAPVKPKE